MANIDFFGVDLGNYSLKISYLKQGGKPKIDKIGSKETLPGLLENESSEGLGTIAEAIKQLHSENSISTKNCVISVPEINVFSRMLIIPKVSESQIEDAIHWGIKPLIPTPLETVNVAYTGITEIKIDGKPHVQWYVVAASKDLVNKMQRITAKAGFRLLAIETEALAIARYVSFMVKQKKDIMIVDIGSETSSIILARNGIAMYSQTLNTGSDAITKVVAAEYGVEESQAEIVKQQIQTQNEETKLKIIQAIGPILDIIVSEISRTIVYYNDKLGRETIDTVYITGGGAKMIGIDELIAQKLQNINVVKAVPSNSVGIARSITKTYKLEDLLSYSVSIGLSLKGIL